MQFWFLKKTTHWHIYCWLTRCYHFFLNVLFLFQWRWSELKKGWRRRKGSLHSSKDSSIVENRCEFLHLFCSSSDILLLPFFLQLFSKPFSTLSPLPLRNDEKTAADYKIQGGSVLHLVLALRGGSTLHRPCLHLSSSSWAGVAMGPVECQRFRCLSQSNHVTAQRSEIPRSRQTQTKRKRIIQQQQKKKKKKGRSISFVDVFL